MNVLIVGGGSIGERHLRCFQQTPPCRVALCEIDTPRREKLHEQYGLERSFVSIEEAASAGPWDAAVICTPANLHVAHASALDASTAALLIEKPLATQLDDARQLRCIAERKPVQVAYVYRVHPAVEAVQELLGQGTIGRLLQMTAVAGQHFPTFRPAYREIYYTRHETGGGAIQDAATHLFNLVHHLAGAFDWVWCDSAHQALEGVEVEDTVHLVGRCRGEQVMVSVALNQFMAPNENFVQLNGTAGSLQIRFHEHRHGQLRHGETQWQWSEPLVGHRDDLFRRQTRRFVDVCRGEAPNPCNVEQGLHTLQVNLAALASQGQRRVRVE